MARAAGAPSRVYVDEFNFSGRTNNLEMAIDNNLAEVTTFLDDGTESVEGQYNGTVTLNGFFDGDSAGYDDQMWSVIGDGIDHFVGLYPGNQAAATNIGYELQAQTSNQTRPVDVAGAILLNVSWQNNGAIVRSTVLKNGAVTGSGVVSGSNQNIGATGAHKTNDTANNVTSANATDLASLQTLLNEIKGDYNTHRASTTYHVVADSTNVITSANASDLSTSITLVNELKLDINAHRSQSGVHVFNDIGNIIGNVDASDLTTAQTLANEIKVDYNAHLSRVEKTAVAILRVLSVTGSGSFTVTVEESSDNAVGDAYSNIISFTAATAVGVERKTKATATEAWKRVNVTAFSGFSTVTILVIIGHEQ